MHAQVHGQNTKQNFCQPFSFLKVVGKDDSWLCPTEVMSCLDGVGCANRNAKGSQKKDKVIRGTSSFSFPCVAMKLKPQKNEHKQVVAWGGKANQSQILLYQGDISHILSAQIKNLDKDIIISEINESDGMPILQTYYTHI